MHEPAWRPQAALSVAAALVAALALPAAASAHHGKDFLLAQTAELPHPGQLFLVSRQDSIDAGEEELEWEPTLLLGVGSRFALELHAHVAREEGESFRYEATAPAFQWRLTPRRARWGLALAGEYEFAALDEEPDRAEARLIVSRPVGRSRLALNLVAAEEREEGSAVEWSYAAGFRRRLAGVVDWGLEAEGDLEGPSRHEVLLGCYAEPSERWTVNVGAGTGMDESELDLSVRTALIWRPR